MRTRDQDYAIDAHKQVQAVKEKYGENARKYGVMCHKLPILVHTAGLAQALAFVESRSEDLYSRLLNDLAETIGEKELSKRAREAELPDYMRLTELVMAALVWYKRFAQSVLGVDVSETNEQETR